eukprot:scaffold1245_cov252-Pinguiococcus_pyrenoidosus.AAC.21
MLPNRLALVLVAHVQHVPLEDLSQRLQRRRGAQLLHGFQLALLLRGVGVDVGVAAGIGLPEDVVLGMLPHQFAHAAVRAAARRSHARSHAGRRGGDGQAAHFAHDGAAGVRRPQDVHVVHVAVHDGAAVGLRHENAHEGRVARRVGARLPELRIRSTGVEVHVLVAVHEDVGHVEQRHDTVAAGVGVVHRIREAGVKRQQQAGGLGEVADPDVEKHGRALEGEVRATQVFRRATHGPRLEEGRRGRRRDWLVGLWSVEGAEHIAQRAGVALLDVVVVLFQFGVQRLAPALHDLLTHDVLGFPSLLGAAHEHGVGQHLRSVHDAEAHDRGLLRPLEEGVGNAQQVRDCDRELAARVGQQLDFVEALFDPQLVHLHLHVLADLLGDALEQGLLAQAKGQSGARIHDLDDAHDGRVGEVELMEDVRAVAVLLQLAQARCRQSGVLLRHGGPGRELFPRKHGHRQDLPVPHGEAEVESVGQQVAFVAGAVDVHGGAAGRRLHGRALPGQGRFHRVDVDLFGLGVDEVEACLFDVEELSDATDDALDHVIHVELGREELHELQLDAGDFRLGRVLVLVRPRAPDRHDLLRFDLPDLGEFALFHLSQEHAKLLHVSSQRLHAIIGASVLVHVQALAQEILDPAHCRVEVISLQHVAHDFSGCDASGTSWLVQQQGSLPEEIARDARRDVSGWLLANRQVHGDLSLLWGCEERAHEETRQRRGG